jgi:ssDNA thymidine ADP-ribosyltransferase, DarT
MTRAELHELGYIVPIATVPSILQHGILSNRRAERIVHDSIALQDVQDLRAKVKVPNGRALHEYVNMYICPRNPMLFKRKDIHARICVIRVSADVIDLPNVVITNSNAGGKYVRFSPAPSGLAIVDRDRTFARNWKHPEDQIDEWRHRSQKMAEVLVPDIVDARYIVGAFVSSGLGEQTLLELAPDVPITINGDLFFQ